MQRFINLSPKDSIGLDAIIYKNALQLKKDAILLVDVRKSYSTATSLMTLSLEEVIKATLVLLHSKGYKIYLLPDAKMFFKDHKIRHQIAQLIEMSYFFIESIDKWKQLNSKKNQSNKWYNLIANIIKIYLDRKQYFTDTKNRIEKLRDFDDLKNKGLYVDFKDELLTPKVLVNKSDYLESKLINERMFKFYKALIILHHLMLKNHMDINKIAKYKSDLKLFINEALKGYSLKSV